MKLIGKAFVVGLAALVVLLLVGLVTTWAPDKPVSELKGRWAQRPSQFVAVGGMQVHLRDEGPRDDPAPIVLLHGTSASLHTWQGWTEALRGQRRVIRFHLPGFALTGPQPQDDYSIDAYARFVVAMLDHLGVQKVVLGGNSLGGQIAWATAVAYPQRVERLLLVDAAGYPFEPKSIPLGLQIARIPILAPLMQRTLPRGMVESSVRNVYGDPVKIKPELVVFDNLGHVPQEEDPVATVAVVKKFLGL